jgi:hypothetical protein
VIKNDSDKKRYEKLWDDGIEKTEQTIDRNSKNARMTL